MLRVLLYRIAFGSLWLALVAGLPTVSARGQGAGKAEYQLYQCQHKAAAEVEKLLKDLLPSDPGVHLVVDTTSNTLLLRGGPEVQQIAKSLLEHVDRPASTAVPRAESTALVKVYHCPAEQMDRWLAAVRAICGDAPGVKITVARESNQVFILATPELHEHVAARLAQSSGEWSTANPAGEAGQQESEPATGTQQSPRRLPAAPRSPVGNQAPAAPLAQAPSNDIDRLLHLRSLPASELEQRLIALFGRRLRATQRDGREVLILPIDQQRAIEFQLDGGRNLVLVRGPEVVVEQFSDLVDALDAGGRAGRRTEALRIERTEPSKLREAVDAYRGGSSSTGDTPAPTGQPAVGDQTNISRSAGGVRLVNYLFQQQGGGVGGAAAAGDLDSAVVPNVPGLEDLEVQTLPDLDVIILRGRDQDVEQLTKIIRELERISAETVPKIHIYSLRHTQGDAVKDIVDEVQTDLVGRRQGRVTVTPLVKPNALLLIGWGEAVDAIIELIAKLDQPVPPESQFAVFPLQHAVVTTVQQTITQFFGTRTGLGPRVQTASDTRTNTLIVYAAPRDMDEVNRLVKELDVPKSGAVNRAQIIRLNNALATDIVLTLEQAIAAAQTGQSGRSAVLELLAVDEQGQEVLRSGMLNEVNITPNPRNNTVIVTAPPAAMDLIEAFIEQLDTPGDRAQIKVFRVLNGDATNLVSMLRSLIPSQAGQSLGPQLPSAPDEESLAPLRFSVEVRSNSIIAVGSEGDLRIVEALLNRLDQSESMNRRNAVYLLKNSPANDVATSINEYLRSQRQLEAAEPGQSNPFQDLEREVIVVPEPVGNRLIVSATPRYFDEITQLIEKLDEPPPQVVIQVLIAEILLNDRDELGVELGLQDTVLFDRSLLGDLLTTTSSTQISDPSGILTTTQEIIQAASNTPGYDFNNKPIGNSGSDSSLSNSKKMGGQALSSFDLGRMNTDAGFGGLVLAASSRNISILIRALQEDRSLRILSRPLVRTLDNQPAFIQVGQRVPRIVGSTMGVNGQSNNIDLENVGLILGVTPRISPDGNVVMEIDAEKSKVGPEEEGIPVAVSMDGTIIRSPRVDTITAQATVSVADGETVVLGGMITTEKETIERRAPYLADIPVLGHLFRYDSSDARRTEMIIILTPRVIRNPEDAERIKQAEFARMSWCAADVYDLYGDIGIDFQNNLRVPTDNSGTQIIYPDANPRGDLQPTPAPLPDDMLPDVPGVDLPSDAVPGVERPNTLPRPVPPLPQGATRTDGLNPVRPADNWRDNLPPQAARTPPPAPAGAAYPLTNYPPPHANNVWNQPASYGPQPPPSVPR